MVNIKNIEKNNDIVKCEIYPEDSKEAGTLSVELSTEKYQYELPAGYEWCENHAAHAAREIVAMNRDGELPKEKRIMWV